ncbi:PLP-dependent aminotransferase family protein [Deinococcus yavapaiensis]|uniref:DNA-binding transcriptional MocR family regulator n=1 Tax=Deinococcus yavapaiensis KR-236 TaxID=694435 RepID=A0A318SFG8_9DEIO|nr:PLP-dependent aminotransferase family protein [Deinococcus yavapaiensis]PYE52744.1 DNA-binding transcriptional MocR family regulator [Deinococcus yavapaiensis KR-236]
MHDLIATRMRSVKPSFVREILKVANRSDIISFAGGLPAPELFDVAGIDDAAREALASDPRGALQYGTTEGFEGLRAQLANLTNARGANVDVDDIVVTGGSQQGIDLIARTLFDPGDIVLVEQPTYLAALQVFELAQADVQGVASDEHGLDVDDLEAKLDALTAAGRRVKALYVVATFANPSGVTLTPERRRRVLELAVRYGFLVVEDDPYSDLRFSGEAVAPILAQRDEVEGAREHAVYLASLSKIVAPGLRIGWMVLPEWLKGAVVIVKQASDLHASTFAQHTAARYLASGRLEAHLGAIRAAYGDRANAMMDSLERHFPSGVLSFERPDGGMFLWARLAEGVDTTAIVNRAIENGVVFVPGASFFVGGTSRPFMRLSYVTSTHERIEEGVRRLARTILD